MFPYISVATVNTVNRITGNSACRSNTLYHSKKSGKYFKIDRYGFLHCYEGTYTEDKCRLEDWVLSKDNEFVLKNTEIVTVDEYCSFLESGININ